MMVIWLFILVIIAAWGGKKALGYFILITGAIVALAILFTPADCHTTPFVAESCK